MPSEPEPHDESPNESSALEWWFVQGYYESPRWGTRNFMASIFRHATESNHSLEHHGASLLLGVLDTKTMRHATSSVVDRNLVRWMSTEGSQLFQNTNLDQVVATAFVKEVSAHGPTRPIRQHELQPEFQSTPFRACWDSFLLAQTEHGFQLCFEEPESLSACCFQLLRVSPRLNALATGGTGTPSGMEYVTYPRLALTGTVGGEPVTGQVWLDHQWGNLNWLLAQSDGGRVLGWDWFGLNLEDGSDWIIMIHRDAETSEPISGHAVVWDRKRECRRTNVLSLTPLRFWRSPRTGISHPVQWRIEIPELEASLLFEPLTDDQEIHLFGTGRAIWEGAGSVSGHIAGEAISGRARGEFQGYGHVFDFHTYLSEAAERIDDTIEASFPKEMDDVALQSYVGKPHWQHDIEAHSATLTRPVWDLIQRKGKRWRPAFGLLMLEAIGEGSESYTSLLCLLAELTHTGSLIIDDIEDCSIVRRGGPAIHTTYGLDVALNAGNTLYFLPYTLVRDHANLNDRQRLEIYEIINHGFVQAHFGQGLDIYWSRHLNRDNLDCWLDDSLAPKILQAYGYKTAAPIAGFAEIAAVIANATPEVRKACASFASMFGVAFQILDDVRNFSESTHWTKIPGEDIVAGKLTYVIVDALGRMDERNREQLIQLLCDPVLRESSAEVTEGIALVRSSGALEACTEIARQMVQDAWTPFSDILPSSEPKVLLRVLCESMLDLPCDP